MTHPVVIVDGQPVPLGEALKLAAADTQQNQQVKGQEQKPVAEQAPIAPNP